jgi:D-alanyl-D-alanine carboxypeptidase/D-alanyl-D-alanine-endopeptidase (penicillin-binding protein 4)
MNRAWTPTLLLALAACTAAPPPPAEDTVARDIAAIVARPAFHAAHVSACFVPLDGGAPLFALNAEKLMVPGSTTKLVTAGVALELLGAEHRFHTDVYATGPIAAGELAGDLVLVASGDANLSGRVRPDGTLAFENHDHGYANLFRAKVVEGDPLAVLRELAHQTAAKGIRRIAGAVRVDASLFAEGDHEHGTGVTISAVALNDNVIDVFVAPGSSVGAAASLRVSPNTAYTHFVNAVTTAAGGAAQVDFASHREADGSFTVTASGSIASGEGERLFAYAVETPSRFAELAFEGALRDAGVEVQPSDPSSRADASVGERQLVAQHVSPPFAEDVKVTLKTSQNLHAAMMPFVLGAVLAGEHGDAAGAGFDRMRAYLTDAGVDLREACQTDGEGGPGSLFSAGFMARFLVFMSGRDDFACFESALPVLGRDGTLVDTLRDSPMAGRVRAKTGTYVLGNPLGNGLVVIGKGLAGYMTTASGRKLAFAVYINHVPTSPSMDEVLAVGDALAEIAEVVFRSN